jgi:hypothetical protein
VALLAVVAVAEIVRIAQVHLVNREARKAEAGRPAPPTPAEVVEAARSLPAPSPPAPDAPDLLASLVKLRYVVTLRGGEGDFAGILTDQQVVATPGGGVELMLVFEHCATLVTHEGDTPADIPGRVILGMSGIAYLQQVG